VGIHENVSYEDDGTPISMAEYLALASSTEVRSFYLEQYSQGWEPFVDHTEPDGSGWWAGFEAVDGPETVSLLSVDVSPLSPKGPPEEVSAIMIFVPASDEGRAP
jgi:hypothetical protein